MQKITRREIEEAAGIYEPKHGTWFPDAVARAQRICAMVPREARIGSVLDAGGFFPSAFVFSRMFTGSHITICGLYNDDIPAPYRDTIHFEHADVTSLPFKDESFDLVYLGEVIEHVYDIRACFTQAHRVLKPNGYLAITTPNLVSWFNRIMIALGRCPVNYHPSPVFMSGVEKARVEDSYDKDQQTTPLYHYHIRLFTISLLIDYTRRMGFDVIAHDAINLFTPDRKFHFLRRILQYVLLPGCREGILLIARKH